MHHCPSCMFLNFDGVDSCIACGTRFSGTRKESSREVTHASSYGEVDYDSIQGDDKWIFSGIFLSSIVLPFIFAITINASEFELGFIFLPFVFFGIVASIIGGWANGRGPRISQGFRIPGRGIYRIKLRWMFSLVVNSSIFIGIFVGILAVYAFFAFGIMAAIFTAWTQGKLEASQEQIAGERQRVSLRHVASKRERLEEWVDSRSPSEFEDLLASIFQKLGYQVTNQPYSGDYGADLVVVKDEKKIIVQAKKYSLPNMVGPSSVRETLGAIGSFAASEAILATTSFFTPAAEQQARNLPIQLWDRDNVMDMAEMALSA